VDQFGFEPNSRALCPVSLLIFLAINPYSTSQSPLAAKRAGALTSMLLAQFAGYVSGAGLIRRLPYRSTRLRCSTFLPPWIRALPVINVPGAKGAYVSSPHARPQRYQRGEVLKVLVVDSNHFAAGTTLAALPCGARDTTSSLPVARPYRLGFLLALASRPSQGFVVCSGGYLQTAQAGNAPACVFRRVLPNPPRTATRRPFYSRSISRTGRSIARRSTLARSCAN